MLSDRGFDVWMGNARGNAYSREHLNFTTDSDEYWRFRSAFFFFFSLFSLLSSPSLSLSLL